MSKPALRRLLTDVAAGADVLLLTDAAELNAILDEAAINLARTRTRPIRVRAGTPGGLGLAGFLAQVTPSAAPSEAPSGPAPGIGPADDAALQRSIRNLTVLDAGCDRIALLVSEADGLQPAALRVVQLACRGSAHLQFVLAGGPDLLEHLEDPEFSLLANRLERTPLTAPAFIPTPAPRPAPLGPAPIPSAPLTPAPLRRPARRSNRAAMGTAAALGVTALILGGIAIGRLHHPSAPPPAALAAAPPATPAPEAHAPTSIAQAQLPAQAPAQPKAPSPAQLAAQAPVPPAPDLPPPPSRPALPSLTPAAPPPSAVPPALVAAPPASAPAPPAATETAQPAPAPAALPVLAQPAPIPAPTEAAAARPPAAPPNREAAIPLPAPPIPPGAVDGPNPRDPARANHSRRTRYARARRGAEWTDPEGRPIPPPQLAPDREDSTPRDPAFGWNQFERPYQDHPYIGTFTTDAHGARIFRYGQ